MDLFSLLYRIEAELRLATPDIRRARRQVEGVPILNHLEKLPDHLASKPTTDEVVWDRLHPVHAQNFLAAMGVYNGWPEFRSTITISKALVASAQPQSQKISPLCWLLIAAEAGRRRCFYHLPELHRLIEVDPYRYLVNTFAALHTGRTDHENLRPKAWAPRNMKETA